MEIEVKQLTERFVERQREPGRFRDQHGLYLQVGKPAMDRKSGKRGDPPKSWLFRFELKGKERWMGLGPVHTVNLTEAREAARLARQQLLAGVDPLALRQAEKQERALSRARTITFKDASLSFHRQHEGKWKNPKHAAQYLNTLKTYAFPVIGELSVAAIDTPLVIKVLEPIWQTKCETASRVRGRIEQVLGWATVSGFRSGDNPARWKNHLSAVLPANKKGSVEHHAALPFRELPTFMVDLRKREALSARALEFAILTAARTGEVIGAKWAEVDLDAKVWTVPAGRMKASKEHRVPLSDRAIQILESLPTEPGNDHLFIGSSKGEGFSDAAMATVLKRMGRTGITVHGFRSCFRDWCAERTSFPNEVIEMSLAHTIGNKVEAAYRRSDLMEKRRKLMEAWGAYCMAPSAEANVTPMRRASS